MIEQVTGRTTASCHSALETLDTLLSALRRQIEDGGRIPLDKTATSICRVMSERRAELNTVAILEQALSVAQFALGALEDSLEAVGGLERNDIKRMLDARVAQILESR